MSILGWCCIRVESEDVFGKKPLFNLYAGEFRFQKLDDIYTSRTEKLVY